MSVDVRTVINQIISAIVAKTPCDVSLLEPLLKGDGGLLNEPIEPGWTILDEVSRRRDGHRPVFDDPYPDECDDEKYARFEELYRLLSKHGAKFFHELPQAAEFYAAAEAERRKAEAERRRVARLDTRGLNPEDVIRAFRDAWARCDEAAIRPLIVDHPDAAMLWQADTPPGVTAALEPFFRALSGDWHEEVPNTVFQTSGPCRIAVLRWSGEWRVKVAPILERGRLAGGGSHRAPAPRACGPLGREPELMASSALWRRGEGTIAVELLGSPSAHGGYYHVRLPNGECVFAPESQVDSATALAVSEAIRRRYPGVEVRTRLGENGATLGGSSEGHIGSSDATAARRVLVGNGYREASADAQLQDGEFAILEEASAGVGGVTEFWLRARFRQGERYDAAGACLTTDCPTGDPVATAETFAAELSAAGGRLDFSLASIETELDRLVGSPLFPSGRDEPPTAAEQRNEAALAAYVGETVRRAFGGEWVGTFHPDSPALNFSRSFVASGEYRFEPHGLVTYSLSEGGDGERFREYLRTRLPLTEAKVPNSQ